MLKDILSELDNLSSRILNKYNEIKAIRNMASINAVQYVEDTGHLNGLEDATDDINLSRYIIEEQINKFLSESTDGQYSAKLGLLNDEIALLKNKLHIQQIELNKYDKINKENSKGKE